MIRHSTLSAFIASTLVLGIASQAPAATLRWASQGDFLTFDVSAQSETLNNVALNTVYEGLTTYDTHMKVVPLLATSWKLNGDKTGWIFKIRQGVKFHEGETLTADDVVFSIKRACSPKSQFKNYVAQVRDVRKIDDYTVEVLTKSPTPVFINQISAIMIMNKAWAEKHGCVEPQNFIGKEESYAARHENGTGPFVLTRREVDVRTEFKAFPGWWNARNKQGNVTEVVYTPIKAAATRTAALLSGQINFLLDPPPQDLARIKAAKNIRILQGPELRTIMISPDLRRDDSPYISVPGRKGVNPFKDLRVRQAMYMAIDIEALHHSVMRGQSQNTGTIVPGAVNAFPQKAAGRFPFDLAKARALMEQAGYKDGFTFTLDTPNNRYINDEAISRALAAMWAKIGITCKVNAVPRSAYFPKVLSFDTSCGFVGWGNGTMDALYNISCLSATYDKSSGSGISNIGRASVPELDRLVAAAAVEGNVARRNDLLAQAYQIEHDQILHFPLHVQMLSWAMDEHVTLPQRPTNKPVFSEVVIRE